jgi:hypothetical protein
MYIHLRPTHAEINQQVDQSSDKNHIKAIEQEMLIWWFRIYFVSYHETLTLLAINLVLKYYKIITF